MIGVLFDSVDPTNTVKIVLSDHGFGRNRGNIYPNYYLHRWGYLSHVVRSESLAKKAYRRFGRALKGLRVLMTTGQGNRLNLRSFQSFTEMVQRTAPHERIPLDWRKTKAALVVGSETGFVYINVRGRGPLGMVEPGPEYEGLVFELITRFDEVRHPRTGEKLFKEVARGADIYPEAAEGVRLPDIVLIPSEGFKFSYEISSAPPELSTHGNHRSEGVLFVEGPELNRKVENFRPRLIDLAPTILHLLRLPVPADMDGRVLQEIFPDPQEIHFAEVDNSIVRQDKIEYNVEETELIEQRLKGLGYIE
jgi:predicted AlkP superfamily phosphohydrolase/phosphomutase